MSTTSDSSSSGSMAPVRKITKMSVSQIRTVFNKINASAQPPDEILRGNFTKFEFSSTKVGNDDDAPSECLRGLWPFIYYTRILGMFPVTRKGSQVIASKWNPFWILSIIGLFVQVIMFGSVMRVMLHPIADSEEWAETITNFVYYGHTIGNTLYMIWKVRHFPAFLHECKKVELICKKYKTAMADDGLVKSCLGLFAFLMSTQVIGNAFYYISQGDRYNVTSVFDFFEIWNIENVGERGNVFYGIFFCLGELYCDLGWIFGDVLLALVSTILTRYFVRLNKEIVARDTSSLELIEEVRADHRSITNLVKHCNDLLAPLFLFTYVANIVYLFSRLYTGLGEDLRDSALFVKIESIYAFAFQIFIKILLPSYLAAQLHEKAHETLVLIHNWPSSINGPDISYRLLVMGRFVTQVVTDTNMGISGCGYFLITKGFVVTLISVLITYEVIILQFQAASLAAA